MSTAKIELLRSIYAAGETSDDFIGCTLSDRILTKELDDLTEVQKDQLADFFVAYTRLHFFVYKPSERYGMFYPHSRLAPTSAINLFGPRNLSEEHFEALDHAKALLPIRKREVTCGLSLGDISITLGEDNTCLISVRADGEVTTVPVPDLRVIALKKWIGAYFTSNKRKAA